jgi:hypothetical protein
MIIVKAYQEKVTYNGYTISEHAYIVLEERSSFTITKKKYKKSIHTLIFLTNKELKYIL